MTALCGAPCLAMEGLPDDYDMHKDKKDKKEKKERKLQRRDTVQGGDDIQGTPARKKRRLVKEISDVKEPQAPEPAPYTRDQLFSAVKTQAAAQVEKRKEVIMEDIKSRKVGGTAPPQYGEAPQDGEIEALGKLFAGLDQCLQFYAMRKSRALLTPLRHDVELHVQKYNFTDKRLMRVLALAGGMLRARWFAPKGDVELAQVAEDGDVRVTSPEELQKRRAVFEEALQAVEAVNMVPMQALPTAPERADAPPVRSIKEHPVASEATVEAIAASGAPLSSAAKFEAMRARIRAKVVVADSIVSKAVIEVRKQIEVCNDALTIHGVVAMLFSKNEMPHTSADKLFKRTEDGEAASSSGSATAVSTSEAQIVSAASSKSYGMQAMRPLSAPSAKASVTYLAAHSADWFVIAEGKFNKGARYLYRQPGGSSAACLAMLQAKSTELKSHHLSLQKGSADSEAVASLVMGSSTSSSSTKPLALEAAAAVAIVQPGILTEAAETAVRSLAAATSSTSMPAQPLAHIASSTVEAVESAIASIPSQLPAETVEVTMESAVVEAAPAAIPVAQALLSAAVADAVIAPMLEKIASVPSVASAQSSTAEVTMESVVVEAAPVAIQVTQALLSAAVADSVIAPMLEKIASVPSVASAQSSTAEVAGHQLLDDVVMLDIEDEEHEDLAIIEAPLTSPAAAAALVTARSQQVPAAVGANTRSRAAALARSMAAASPVPAARREVDQVAPKPARATAASSKPDKKVVGPTVKPAPKAQDSKAKASGKAAPKAKAKVLPKGKAKAGAKKNGK